MNGSGATPVTFTAHSVGLSCNATKFLGSGSYNAAQVSGFFAAGHEQQRRCVHADLLQPVRQRLE